MWINPNIMRKYTITAITLSCAIAMSAAPISPDQALSRILGTRAINAPGYNNKDLKLKYTSRQENGDAAAYIFTPSDGVGFTILSADDMAIPVYGYSDSGTFDINNIPPALEWWLNGLASEIDEARLVGLERATTSAYAPAEMTPIAPLVKTKWNQDAPYNNQTPEINGRHTYTGCVATSFAQAMKYFNYPQRGVGNITYYDSGTRRVLNFTKDFQWDLMLDTYKTGSYTQEQADAVAFLMKACGYSVEMSYGLQASGAVSQKLAQAAVKYFKYDEGINYYERTYFTLDEWTSKIYDNLKNVGPVIYDGDEMAGGHSFICDGYDGNGYFHFNWGWGGMSDGYFILDALNPDSQGIGASEGGFNKGQGALFGLQPPVEGSQAAQAQMKLMGSVTASLEGNSLVFSIDGSSHTSPGWASAYYKDVTFNVGAIISEVSSSTNDIDVKGDLRYQSGYTTGDVNLTPTTYFPGATTNLVIALPSLNNGTYKVTVAARASDQIGAAFLPMLCENGNANYCYLMVADGKFTVTSVPIKKITYDKVWLTTPLYYGKNCRIAIEATNTSDTQLSESYYPVLYRDGKIQYMGDYMLLTVNAGATTTSESFTRFVQVQGATSTGKGTYTLGLADANTNQLIGTFGECEMDYLSGKLSITLNDFSVEGASQENVTVGSRTFNDVFIVDTAEEIDIIVDYTVNQGYFDSSLRVVGAMYDPDTKQFVSMSEDVYVDYPFTDAGSDNKVTIPMKLDGLKGGMIYRLAAGYTENGNTNTLGIIYFRFTGSGVESIVDDTTSEAVYYNLQGMRVDNPRPGQLLIRKQGDKSQKIIF